MRKGFTLIELLIVIGIIGILATVAVLVVNPAEILRQSRDSKRLAELGLLNSSLNFAMVQDPKVILGTANTIYISLPDTSPTCANHSLPALPQGWSYACVDEVNLYRTDGQGWLPVDFHSIPNYPIATLPVDPANSATAELYYTYVPGWELGANMESKKFEFGGSGDMESTDGGSDDFAYEIGLDLTLAPAAGGEVIAQVDLGCYDDYYATGEAFEFYNKWTIPGSGTVTVTKLWYWQPDSSLNSDESVEVALYNGGVPNYNKISESVFINGTGAIGWVSGDLATPISITLGQTYISGIGPGVGNYSLARDAPAFCGGYQPTGPSYLELKAGGLNPTAPTDSQSINHYGFIGISYIP